MLQGKNKLEVIFMNIPVIHDSEYRLCLILWEVGPINSTKLVKICKERIGWAKATTYTVIRRLSERGILKNENTIVSMLHTKEEVQQSAMERLLNKTFEGSLPAFIAAFGHSKKLKESEIAELESMIENFQGE